jgi:hypothetical protein
MMKSSVHSVPHADTPLVEFTIVNRKSAFGAGAWS